MNVYVRELVASLAQAGVQSTVYVRRWRDDLPPVVTVEPGFRVVHVPAARLVDQRAAAVDVDEFTDFVIDDLRADGDVDALHANYWLSGSPRTASSTRSTCRSCRCSTPSPRQGRHR
jgi:D-inositol-3-phosphate glycosyltransferase